MTSESDLNLLILNKLWSITSFVDTLLRALFVFCEKNGKRSGSTYLGKKDKRIKIKPAKAMEEGEDAVASNTQKFLSSEGRRFHYIPKRYEECKIS